MYEDWAKAHGASVNSLLVLSAIHEGMGDCTQKKISQRWRIPKQTVNSVLKNFERKELIYDWEGGTGICCGLQKPVSIHSHMLLYKSIYFPKAMDRIIYKITYKISA